MKRLFIAFHFFLALYNDNLFPQIQTNNIDSINIDMLRQGHDQKSNFPLFYLNYTPFSGKAYERWENGNVKREITYKLGAYTSTKEFYESGKIAKEIFSDFFPLNCTFTQVTDIEFYQNGQKKNEIRYKIITTNDGNFPRKEKGDILFVKVYHENGKIAVLNIGSNNGPFTSYYENGQIKENGTNGNNPYFKLDTYTDGLPYGMWKGYYQNGNLEYEGSYAFARNNDEVNIDNSPYYSPKTGVWKYYHENGEVSVFGAYRKGYKNGVWNEYFSNKVLKSTGTYQKDKKIGLWKEYYSNGKLKSNGKFAEYESKIGTWRLYSEEGILVSVNNYRETGRWDTEFEGIQAYYFTNGVLKATENYWQGKKEGVFYNYFESGKIESEINYIADIRNGVSRKYFESGILEYEKTYLNDREDGYYKINYPNGNLAEKGILITKYSKTNNCACPYDSCVSEKYYVSGNLKFKKVTTNKFIKNYLPGVDATVGHLECTFYYDSPESKIAAKIILTSCHQKNREITFYDINGRTKIIPYEDRYSTEVDDPKLFEYIENYIKSMQVTEN